MNNVITVITMIVITFSSSLFLSATHAAENKYKPGYISDDLFIYMHTGPGTNYRILGTITAGSEIKITGASDNNYSEIIDEQNRTAWVESKYVTTQAGLRFVVADLNKQIADSTNFTSKLDGEVNELNSKLNLLTNEKANLTTELTELTKTLERTQAKIKDQDTNIKKQWFFNGALVLGIGLILGLVLPKLFARRRGSMDSWS
ncbi:TIGR04211 family SH3 domain-containing protein [Colwellia sp. E2M01]|uniref:TIGR04211 family SH3 domain-containing protein n=1 Tax=Colwellia sp. E2M01 TaxID=2841561 RepID=UPI001C0A00F2|nr:TIGR04211 family SH3 domain-containing protein [Colwellia sp. E2M01]MBU2869685.1 TIGR04211 family SH3 domain-containing protein [Colwellia sp. E2M01]